MRDPDLVVRAQQAATALESAWCRWRNMHGLAADPAPAVSSYVGFSLDAPWGQPRIVFGICAVFMLADSVLSALLAPFVATEVSSAAWTFGVLLALRGVGGLLGGVLTGLLGGRLRPATALGLSLIGVGLVGFAFVNVSEPVVAYVTIVVIGVLIILAVSIDQWIRKVKA